MLKPKPCPRCGCTNIYSVFIGGGCEKILPFWVRMRCARCGLRSKNKLFRSRAVRAWNRGRYTIEL